MRPLRKTGARTAFFLLQALMWRPAERQHVVVAWGLVAGLVWFTASLTSGPGLAPLAVAGCYLLVLLAAVCAIDGRYGIIPDSLVWALAAGGALQTLLLGLGDLLWCGLEALGVFAAGSLFRAGYRWLRGYDGLGFGDVKFVSAGTLWIGLGGIPGLLLIAVVSASVSLLILKFEGYDLHGKQAISFGPHLALGLWLIWVWGPQSV